MGISKDSIKLIYSLAESPYKLQDLDEDTIEDLLANASDLAQYYEAEEQRRWEKETSTRGRRE